MSQGICESSPTNERIVSLRGTHHSHRYYCNYLIILGKSTPGGVLRLVVVLCDPDPYPKESIRVGSYGSDYGISRSLIQPDRLGVGTDSGTLR